MSNHKCDPKDIALKSFFLGPQAENAPWFKELVNDLFDRWFNWRRNIYPMDGRAISEKDQALGEFLERRDKFALVLGDLMSRFENEVPKFSPRYIGHMFSEVSLPALLGHVVALLHNPNNISEESSRVGVQIENEAIRALLDMVGYPATSIGHFTSGGTLANFEALVRARNRITASKLDAQRAVLLLPDNKHYSWTKAASLVGLAEDCVWKVKLDSSARLSVQDLRRHLNRAVEQDRPVMMVVTVAGSTELGTFDPVDEVQNLLDDFHESYGLFPWHHVDAAYGGFFRTLGNASNLLSHSTQAALDAMRRADSITLDPHKLGYIPYSCGAFLIRDQRNYRLLNFGAPYVDSDGEHDRGLFTLEGSRSGAGAAATWMIARTTGLGEEGYGRILSRTIQARAELQHKLNTSGLPVRTLQSEDSNILCFHVAFPNERISVSNQRMLNLLKHFSTERNSDFFLSMTRLNWSSYGEFLDAFTHAWSAECDESELVVARLCLMNPFFNSKETRISFPDEFVLALGKVIQAVSL